MALNTAALLQKAILSDSDGSAGAFAGTGGDFGTGSGPLGAHAPISIEQVTAFIELMAAQQVMLGEARTVTSSAAKWQESIIQFAKRIARPGVEATRLKESDRTKPDTGVVELSTALIRGEVPVSDEVTEDNVAGTGIIASIERTMTDQFGFDVEDLMINGDTTNGSDEYLALLDGWLKQAKDNGVSFAASSYGEDYQEIFKQALTRMPKRFLRNLRVDGRFYVPVTLEQKYRDILASRGTPYGDIMLTGNNDLTYQGIKITSAPSIDAGIDADASVVLLTNRNNLYAGYHRAMKFETFRDPREGATSFLITTRVDSKVAVPAATVLAYDVDVSL